MSKRKLYFTVLVIFVLAGFVAALDFPEYSNRGISFLNSKIGKDILPNFPEIEFKRGLDLQGGTHLIYQADLSDINPDEHSQAMQGLRDVIERRVNLFGVQEPLVQIQETDDRYRLIVELAGVKDIGQAVEMIGQTPFLEFKEPKENFKEILEANQIVYESGEGEFQDPFQPTDLTGRYFEKAIINFNNTTSKPIVLIQFDDEGSKLFEDLTTKHVGNPIAIYIDGVQISSPVVQEPISGGKAQITGSFTIEEARTLIRNLNAGALPIPISLISQQSVGPTLGEESLQKSLKAGIAGLLAVVIFLILFYRIPGLLASLSLGIYVVLVLGLFKLIPITITLAGVGGFILSIGMAIDANILIFSRIREELKEDKSFSLAIEEGFKRAWSSIRDGNLTTLIVALIIFTFGTSFVRGFALTLSIGILVSMFSAIFITKNFLRIFIGTKLENFKWLWK